LTTVRDFENNLTPLLLDFAPSILAPKAHRGRQAIKLALSKHYMAQYDLKSDIARITKQRAAILREHGMSNHDLGRSVFFTELLQKRHLERLVPKMGAAVGSLNEVKKHAPHCALLIDCCLQAKMMD
jgi:hypothetical protein